MYHRGHPTVILTLRVPYSYAFHRLTGVLSSWVEPSSFARQTCAGLKFWIAFLIGSSVLTSCYEQAVPFVYAVTFGRCRPNVVLYAWHGIEKCSDLFIWSGLICFEELKRSDSDPKAIRKPFLSHCPHDWDCSLLRTCLGTGEDLQAAWIVRFTGKAVFNCWRIFGWSPILFNGVRLVKATAIM